jgi:hypothetical protein
MGGYSICGPCYRLYIWAFNPRFIGLDETLVAKQAFEKLVAQAGGDVTRYHADNGRYADKGFLASINANQPNYHVLWGRSSSSERGCQEKNLAYHRGV